MQSIIEAAWEDRSLLEKSETQEVMSKDWTSDESDY